MSESRPIPVVGRSGLRGWVIPGPPQPTGELLVQLENGRELLVEPVALQWAGDHYTFDFGPEDLASILTPQPEPMGQRDSAMPAYADDPPHDRRAVPTQPEPASQRDTVIPVYAEDLHVDKRTVTTGGIRVTKRVREHDEIVDLPLYAEQVDVRRVIINQPVDGPMPVRQEGDTIIVPIVEEVLRVRKELVLKEEVHLTRVRTERRGEERVTLQREEAFVERVDADGNVVSSEPAAPAGPSRAAAMNPSPLGPMPLGPEQPLGPATGVPRQERRVRQNKIIR